MFVSNREILKKTAATYILQAGRVLHFCGVEPEAIRRHKEISSVIGRMIKPKPKREYFALE